MNKGVDSHCHVFDTTLFPYTADAAYQPPPHGAGSREQLAAVLDAHGLSHPLLVNPTSGYGYDNRCLIAAIAASHGRFKGMARVHPDTDQRGLARLRDGGVILIRLDLISDGVALLHQPGLARLLTQVREMQ